jgi:hypothetical protein
MYVLSVTNRNNMTSVNEVNLKTRMENQKAGGKLVVAFDVDDTLIIPTCVTGADRDLPNHKVIQIYRFFQLQGNHMIVWSGGGVPYAKRWAEELGLHPDEIRMKGTGHVDIAFDDCDVKIATVNVKVKRIRNSISRAEWNKHE